MGWMRKNEGPVSPTGHNPARGKGPTASVYKRGPDLSAGGDEDDRSRQELGRRRPPVRGAATNGAR